MAVTGILCEYNPFHKGHAKQIRYLKDRGDTVVCLMSGDYVHGANRRCWTSPCGQKRLWRPGRTWCWNCRCRCPCPRRRASPPEGWAFSPYCATPCASGRSIQKPRTFSPRRRRCCPTGSRFSSGRNWRRGYLSQSQAGGFGADGRGVRAAGFPQ